MTRIGITGIENSHADHYVRYLNAEHRHGDARVTALVAGEAARNDALTAGGGVELVDSARDLVGRVDAAIVCNRSGSLHRENAVPLLEAGIPVLVDKPLAASVADAREIIAAAKRSGAVLASHSALRFVPQVEELAAGGDGPPKVVTATGPADPGSEYDGLFFYGVHPVEVALHLVGDVAAEDVHVQRVPGAVVATARAGETALVVSFVAPTDAGRVPFQASVAGAAGLRASELPLGADYNAPGLARFMSAVDAGRWPMTAEALLAPVRFLAEVVAAL